METNDHYEGVVERSFAGKDSELEIGEITSYDSKRMVANVMGLRTKEVKEDVIVTFPNLFMNSGIIAFPLNKTKGLLYVGPDNQNYFFPAQFHLPYMDSVDGEAVIDASPARIDPFINFADFEQGEFLIRHLSGTQNVFRNDGSYEVSTNKGHNISIDSVNGELSTLFETVVNRVGYGERIEGVVQPENSKQKARYVVKERLCEEGPEWKNSASVTIHDAMELINDKDINLSLPEMKEMYALDWMNVLDSKGEPVMHNDAELFSRELITFEKATIKELVNKAGEFERWINADQSENYEYQDSKRRRVEMSTGENDELTELTTSTNKTITIKDASGRRLYIDSSPRGFIVRQSGSGSTKTIEIDGSAIRMSDGNNTVELNSSGITSRRGSSKLTVSNSDISMTTSEGTVTANELIRHLR